MLSDACPRAGVLITIRQFRELASRLASKNTYPLASLAMIFFPLSLTDNLLGQLFSDLASKKF
jgi:hypothetical protein